MIASLLLAVLAGCAEQDPVDQPYVRLVPCPDWPSPQWIGDGELVSCDAERIVVRHPGEQPEPVMERWRALLASEGWTVLVDNSAPGMPSVRWKREGVTLVTGVAVADGSTYATAAQGGAVITPTQTVPEPVLPVPTTPP